MAFSVGNRLIAAIDTPSRSDADAFVQRLAGVPSWVKVGLELFLAEGPSIVRDYTARGRSVMLDLLLLDIPESVARATARVASLGAGLLTVHSGGGRAMLEAAVKAAGATKILAVTVLTSMDDADLADIGAQGPVEDLVRGPGERIVYGAGPVRVRVARRASSIVAVWVDPRRADKSAGDPVAQIVTAARAAGIRVQDRAREHLDRALREE